jgi:hypothetical protein
MRRTGLDILLWDLRSPRWQRKEPFHSTRELRCPDWQGEELTPHSARTSALQAGKKELTSTLSWDLHRLIWHGEEPSFTLPGNFCTPQWQKEEPTLTLPWDLHCPDWKKVEVASALRDLHFPGWPGEELTYKHSGDLCCPDWKDLYIHRDLRCPNLTYPN